MTSRRPPPARRASGCRAAFAYFPAGSVHVAVVDPGVGTERAVLASAWDGHLFLAPDNGILPMVAGPSARLHTLSADWAGQQNWPSPSHTFHGRDIFAPLAAAFLNGTARPEDIGPLAAAAGAAGHCPAGHRRPVRHRRRGFN